MAKEGSGAKLYLSQTKFLLPLATFCFLTSACFWNAYSFLLPAYLLQLPAQTHTHIPNIHMFKFNPSFKGQQTWCSFLNLSSSPQVILFPLCAPCRTKLGFIDLSMVFYLLLQCGVAGHLSVSLYPQHLAQLMCRKV